MTRRYVLLLLGIVFALWASFASGRATFETIALTGQQAPGAEEGVVFAGFKTTLVFDGIEPRINASGQVFFGADLSGAGVHESNDGGAWVGGSSASLSMVGRQGDQAPGAPSGVVFGPRAFTFVPSGLGSGNRGANFNDSGQFLYWAELAGSGVDNSNNAGVWTGSSAESTRLVARTGDQAPGLPDGQVFSWLSRSNPMLNAQGQFTLSGSVTGRGVTVGQNDDVLWAGDSTSGLSVVARHGDLAPGTRERFALHGYGGFHAAIDNSGKVQVNSPLSPDGRWRDNDIGLWEVDSNNDLTLLARRDDPAPGLGSLRLGSPVIRRVNEAGQFAFLSRLRGPGATIENSGSIWISTRGGDPMLVVRQADPGFPGTVGPLTFEVVGRPVLNNRGSFVFDVQWDHEETNDPYLSGVLMGTSPEDVSLIVGGLDPVPGLEGSLGISSVSRLMINDHDQVVFQARIRNTDLSTSIGKGIWGYDSLGGAELLVRTGELFEVAPGDWRTVSDLRISGGSALADGDVRGLTNAGQFVFRAVFTDGSEGVFVGSLPVPEPCTLELLLAALGVSVLKPTRW